MEILYMGLELGLVRIQVHPNPEVDCLCWASLCISAVGNLCSSLQQLSPGFEPDPVWSQPKLIYSIFKSLWEHTNETFGHELKK